jgi:hypothetical protein
MDASIQPATHGADGALNLHARLIQALADHQRSVDSASVTDVLSPLSPSSSKWSAAAVLGTDAVRF